MALIPEVLQLSRRGPRGTSIERAEELFRYVRSRGQERAVDRQCIVSAFREAAMLPRSTQMNINVHASTIADDSDLVQFIAWSARAHEMELSRLVIEVIQCGPSTEKRSFQKTIGALRATGVGIALDDIGTGYASYRTLSVSSSSPSATYGQSVTFTATLDPSSATGTVQFRIDGTNAGADQHQQRRCGVQHVLACGDNPQRRRCVQRRSPRLCRHRSASAREASLLRAAR